MFLVRNGRDSFYRLCIKPVRPIPSHARSRLFVGENIGCEPRLGR
jgi:hypothetical protein